MAAKPLAYQQATSLNAAKTTAVATGSAIPSGTVWATVQAEAQDVRYTLDGTTPTATVGTLLKAGQPATIFLMTELQVAKWIEATASAKLNFQFYKN